MKFPRKLRTHCRRCNTHTAHSAALYKPGKRRGAKKGERRQAARKKGYGGQKYPEQRNQAKTTKKLTIVLECDECGYKMHRDGIRLNKLEIV